MAWEYKREESQFAVLPEGRYRIRIKSADKVVAKTGRDMLSFCFEVSGKSNLLFHNIVFLEDRPDITNRSLTQFFDSFKDIPEGELTKLRASLVCEKSLCIFARKLQLGKYLMLGKGEDKGGGRERDSILADAFEAVLAAIYLDGGIKPATKFVLSFVEKELENHNKQTFKDYKTALQEIIQRNPEEYVTYVLKGESGPDHDKVFEVEVHLNSNVIGCGKGKNKKQAEQMAAKQALELMGAEI